MAATDLHYLGLVDVGRKIQAKELSSVEATKAMQTNHARTMQSEKQICSGGGVAGGQRPTGPGLSDALGTTRSGSLDPLAPNSGTLDTLTGNVLAR